MIIILIPSIPLYEFSMFHIDAAQICVVSAMHTTKCDETQQHTELNVFTIILYSIGFVHFLWIRFAFQAFLQKNRRQMNDTRQPNGMATMIESYGENECRVATRRREKSLSKKT